MTARRPDSKFGVGHGHFGWDLVAQALVNQVDCFRVRRHSGIIAKTRGMRFSLHWIHIGTGLPL